jgi:hypothetical protein
MFRRSEPWCRIATGLCALKGCLVTKQGMDRPVHYSTVYDDLTARPENRDSSVSIATGYSLEDRGSRFHSRRGLGIFLFTTESKTALGSTQPPIQWVPGALSLEVKWPGREADHSPPSSAEVKNAWNYTSTHPILFHGVVIS